MGARGLSSDEPITAGLGSDEPRTLLVASIETAAATKAVNVWVALC